LAKKQQFRYLTVSHGVTPGRSGISTVDERQAL
jgi:hypothetical protein